MNIPVLSPVKTKARSTVKIGAELLTVSVKETVTYFKAMSPRKTVVNLKQEKQKQAISAHERALCQLTVCFE